MSKFARNLSILIVAIMLGVALASCGTPTPEATPEPVVEPTTPPVVEPEPTAEPEPTEVPVVDIPLVVAYNEFSQKFSPFFGDTAYDMDVAGMTQIGIMTTDRMGGIIYNAIEGETRNYNGTDYLYTGPADIKVEYDEASDTTKYTAKIREDLVFSDGDPLTADDIIFTYYTYLDPSYVGSTSLGSYGILGLKDYQTQTTSEVYDKYSVMAGEIFAAGVDHEWSDADAWTKEQQDDFWARLKEAWMADVQAIVDYVNAEYPDYFVDYIGYTPEEVAAQPGLDVVAGMTLWGFGGTGCSFNEAPVAEEGKQIDNSIVDIAVADGRFTTLVAAVQAAGLDTLLDSEGSFTVFAPTDDAFAKLEEGTVEALLEDIPTLTSILLHHVVGGEVMADQVVTLTEAETVLGEKVAVKVEDGKVFINDAEVIITDIEADNGVIHVIDTVLLPPEGRDCQTWGFEDALGTKYDLVESFPTVEDYYNVTYLAYEGDPVAYASVESPSGADILGNVTTAFIGYWGPMDESMGEGGVPNISGIVKVDDYTVEVTTAGYEAPAVYSILGVSITPLHYYGDAAKFDYENNMFGFDFGDLSKQESLTATPMGAGPYKFLRYENKVVYFEANDLYYKGAPKIKEVQFKETVSAEVPSSLATGAADAGEMSYNATRYEEVMSYNGNGEMTGPVITSSLVDNLGYGYIGINASTVNVAGDPASDASKNLRRGLATILSVYRDVAIDSYYGEAAAVINYPISNTSWAAPQPTDEGYQIAFSVDVEGNPIYTAEMSYEDRYAAAEQAALGFFEAAGFTVTDGKLTAAPDGAKLDYEVIVPGGGTGDHPAFAILTGAQASFANIGLEFKINDPADTNILWDALDSATQELWTAAWGSTIDPDMYQVYHSTSVVGAGGSESNHYHITDPDLDQLIVDARLSDDQAYRKAIYKQALDKIIEWAVEIPTYQRKNVIIFSTERINLDTLTPDITTFWGWMNDIELLEMNQQ